LSDAAYFAGLARKQVGAGALITDVARRILLVQRAYGDRGWTVPGGAADAGESPLAATRREVSEELGLEVAIGRILGVEWIPERPPKPEALVFLFDGGELTPEQADQIQLPPDELTRHRWLTLEQARVLVTGRMHRRLQEALRARELGTAVYLEPSPGEL
jgi:8-oxo-dGTP diphosphatase